METNPISSNIGKRIMASIRISRETTMVDNMMTRKKRLPNIIIKSDIIIIITKIEKEKMTDSSTIDSILTIGKPEVKRIKNTLNNRRNNM